MPFPAALLWAGAALAAGYGIKKGIDAKEDLDSAERIGKRAQEKYDEANKMLEIDRETTQRALEELGELKVSVFSDQIKHLVDMHKKFRSKLEGYDEDFLIENLSDVEVLVKESLEMEKGLGTGIVSGALLAMGAYGSVGLLATASTGTAIASLSGVAATNATLAWLGGGSLAAGGFGMAGGMIALGGIAIAPILAIGGAWMAGKAEESLSKACRFSDEVDVAVEQMEQVKLVLKGVRSSIAEMSAIISELVFRFEQVKVYDMSNEKKFQEMLLIGKGLKKVLDIPVINEDGTGNANIRKICSDNAIFLGDYEQNY